MASSKFFHGSPLLMGDNTVPGLQIPEELNKLLPDIFKACRDFGLDFYPTVVQMLTYSEISEIAAYGGFPVRYPHWQFGMEYEELQRGYEHGMHRIYEMVINTSPCYIYCLDSNTILDNVTVVAHALGHNDFFKNNVFFSATNTDMMDQLANHGTRIRKYIARWGKEKVTEFIDHCLRISTLIDATKAWDKKIVKDVVVTDSRKWKHPKRLDYDESHDYMDRYINTPEWTKKQRDKIERDEVANEIEIFKGETNDIMGFLRDNAQLKPWQTDIVAMLHQEAMYFAPQRFTKMLNEGWASYIDYQIMCKKGLCGLGQKSHDGGIFEYAAHKMGVLGGKYSTNPYKLGYCLFLDIEERWNKGRFGTTYDDCDNLEQKLNWDEKLNLGNEKVFEVRKCYNDLTALMEFFTPEFCAKHEFFNWKRMPNGDIKMEDRDFKKIKHNLLKRYANGGLPEITLVDCNHRGRNILLLEHNHIGEPLYLPYVEAVLQSLYYFWKHDVYLTSKDDDGTEIIYIATEGEGDEAKVDFISREEYDKGKHSSLLGRQRKE